MLAEEASNQGPRSLSDLRRGERGILDRLEVSEDVAHRLMELGFLTGVRVTAGRSAPGGDPMVFQVDGCEVALRRETARCLKLRSQTQTNAKEDDV